VEEDRKRIQRIKNGEIEEFSFLVEKYHHRLLSFIHRLVGDASIVEDLGQDVFLNIYKSLADFNEQGKVPFAAWLFIVARNRAISELRRRGRLNITAFDESNAVSDPAPYGVDVLIDRERRQALQDSLAQLPEIYQSVILKSLQGDSIREIAQLEYITQGTVKSRLFRARKQLKSLLCGGKRSETI
jgi:RNA polymerase sigma-70 factor (ECF subfamily)